MSMSRACELVELTPDQWYCVVAWAEYDYEFASGHTVYGPAPTEEAAWKMMADRECNPGQSVTIEYGDVGDRERKLIEAGYRPDRRSRCWQ